MNIKEYKKEFEERFGAMWMAKRPQDYVDSTVGEDGEKLWNFFETKLNEVREEAAKDFAIWFEANTGGLFRGEMEEKWNEYLTTKEGK